MWPSISLSAKKSCLPSKPFIYFPVSETQLNWVSILALYHRLFPVIRWFSPSSTVYGLSFCLLCYCAVKVKDSEIARGRGAWDCEIQRWEWCGTVCSTRGGERESQMTLFFFYNPPRANPAQPIHTESHLCVPSKQSRTVSRNELRWLGHAGKSLVARRGGAWGGGRRCLKTSLQVGNGVWGICDQGTGTERGTRTRNYLGKIKLSAFKAAAAYVRSSPTCVTRSWRQHAFNIALWRAAGTTYFVFLKCFFLYLIFWGRGRG